MTLDRSNLASKNFIVHGITIFNVLLYMLQLTKKN